ncbi:hypothetical protein CCZ37_16600 [Vibrio qinghaiensis]|uniref:Uncharacterized protein n=1 Tax=Vibrio qinghaiensis TaxID=2025808 RepID=A0A223N347_9VIBR|nr:hypothetical protein CCZ37_16600 [Vibrio qinghaiensis]
MFKSAFVITVVILSSVFCVVSPLTGRYATQVNLGAQSFGIFPAIRFVLSANEHFYLQIHCELKP